MPAAEVALRLEPVVNYINDRRADQNSVAKPTWVGLGQRTAACRFPAGFLCRTQLKGSSVIEPAFSYPQRAEANRHREQIVQSMRTRMSLTAARRYWDTFDAR